VEVRARDRDDLAHGVVLGAGGLAELVLARAREDVDFRLHVRGDGGERGGVVRLRLAFDEAELQLGRGADDVFDAGRIVDAGELDDDAVAALRSDERLGDDEGVHAVADGLDGVLDGVALDRRLRGRLHPELHRPFGGAAHLERAEVVLRDALVLAGVGAGRRRGHEGRRIDLARRRNDQAVLRRLRFQRFHRLIGLERDGVADVHAHDEMRAALEVEAAADRLGITLRRDDRDREDHEDRDDQYHSPKHTFVQAKPPDWKPERRYSASRPARPVIAERATRILTLSATLSCTTSPSTPWMEP